MYAGPVEIEGERMDRELMEGVSLMSKGQIGVPHEWIITPAQMTMTERQTGLPNLSAEFLSTCRDLRRAAAPVWKRYFTMMCDHV